MPRPLVYFLVAPLATYALLVLAARLGYRRLLYPIPPGGTWFPPDAGSLREFVTKDGVKGHALDIGTPRAKRTIAYFHGNGETIANNVELALALSARGLRVLLVEYRGYGLSSVGQPSEHGLYLDAEAALDMLAGEGTGSDKIVLWGTSLGTGVAAEMAQRGRGAALILVAPYTSIPALAARIAPFLPVSPIVGDRFDTQKKAPTIRVPTLIVHGDEDEVIPFAMGRALSSLIPASHIIALRGAHHNDWRDVGGAKLLESISAFLTAVGGG